MPTPIWLIWSRDAPEVTMKRMHWFLLAALAAPAAAAPAALTPNEITSADRRATRLSVNLGDEELPTLAQCSVSVGLPR